VADRAARSNFYTSPIRSTASLSRQDHQTFFRISNSYRISSQVFFGD
jgi:hypothetical protein